MDRKNLSADYHFLLEPISEENPCGEDLEYDPQYMDLFIRIVPREKKVIGGGMGSERLESEIEPIRWSEVERDCLDVLRRTKDIRVLLVLLRCRVQQAQSHGLRQGLFVLERFLTLWPDELFPRMTSEGESDLLPRSDALMSLVEVQGILSDIRGLAVSGTGGMRLEMRDIERSFSLPVPEDALPPEAMRHRLQEVRGHNPPEYQALIESLQLVRTIDRLVREQLEVEAPDLGPLLTLLGRLEPRNMPELVESSTPVASPDEETNLTQDEPRIIPSPPIESNETAIMSSFISNRHVARERIRDVRVWFEENEPSSPVPVLLRQAEQLIGRRFADLVHCLPDELLNKWENE